MPSPLQPLNRLARLLAGSSLAARWWRMLLIVLAAAVGYLALVPRPPLGADLGWDKLNHLAAFASLAVCAWLGDPASRVARPWLLGGLLAFGGLIEVLQLGVPGRSAEWSDLFADATGIAVGAFIAAVLLRAASGPTARSG